MSDELETFYITLCCRTIFETYNETVYSITNDLQSWLWLKVIGNVILREIIWTFIRGRKSRLHLLCLRRGGKGVISVAFFRPSVCLSVCPSVAYIANNSRTQSPSVPKFGRTVPHLTSFKVKRSKVRVTGPVNADTHRAPYLPNSKAYELQTW